MKISRTDPKLIKSVLATLESALLSRAIQVSQGFMSQGGTKQQVIIIVPSRLTDEIMFQILLDGYEV